MRRPIGGLLAPKTQCLCDPAGRSGPDLRGRTSAEDTGSGIACRQALFWRAALWPTALRPAFGPWVDSQDRPLAHLRSFWAQRATFFSRIPPLPMAHIPYNFVRLALIALSVAFASFFVVTVKNIEIIQKIVGYSTKYLPVLLVPVGVAMIAALLFRYLGKSKNEHIGLGDLASGFIALGLHVAAIIVWRAQGNEVVTVAGEFAINIPDIKELSQHASSFGVLGIAALEFGAYYFFSAADPDRD